MSSELLKGLMEQHSKPVDNVPAKLTENEFVIPADVVLILGNGDAKTGAKKLQSFVDSVRQGMKGN